MQLSELYLNRYLYRDNNQSLETKDSVFVSADSSDSEPSYVASGGAAQDINSGNVQINGAQLEPGTYPLTVLDVSNWGWGQTCAFTSASLNTVTWGSGTFTSADGTSYAISAGTTGVMAAKTYIYLSLLDSETEYQVTTTSSDAVGLGKVLIAVAENAAVSATYMLSEATQIVGDNIIANTIDASKITTGQLIVGTNVGLGTAFPSASAGNLAYEDLVGAALLDSTVIVGGYIKTSLLTANNIQTGTLNAINITGSTITGSVLQTGTSGFNVNIQSAQIQIRDGASVVATWAEDGFSGGTALLTTNATQVVVSNVSGYIVGDGLRLKIAQNTVPNSDGSYYLGDSSYGWGRLYLGTSARYLYDNGGTLTWNGSAIPSGNGIPSGGSSQQFLKYSSSGVATWAYLGATANASSIIPSSSTVTLGNSTYYWDNIWGAELNLKATSSNPGSAGDIRNYASGGTDQFRGIPGDGTWMGSFDMTAA